MADFEHLFSENYDFIYKYLTKLCKDPSLAEELTQETFFRAYMNLGQLHNQERIAAWLCQIAKNSFYTWYRESQKYGPLNENAADSSPDLADALIRKELSKETFAKLHELEEPYKEVFLLSVFANLSFVEISALFGKSESWARVTFFRAKQKMKGKLRDKHAL